MEKPLDFWVKWIGTIMALIHVILVSEDVYPYYKFSGLFAAFLWTWLGYLWKEPSVIILNAIMMAIYINGIIKIL